MKMKLLGGVLALVLFSANIPQMTFAEEFTSGISEEKPAEETREFSADDNQDTIDGTSEETSTFSSEDVPAFSGEAEAALAAAQGGVGAEINLSDNSNVSGGVYTISAAGTYKFTSNNTQTSNRIEIKDISSNQDKVEIYLNNLNINTPSGAALIINSNVNAEVYIYLKGTNNLITTNVNSAGLQKCNNAKLTITNEPGNTGTRSLNASNSAIFSDGDIYNVGKGAGIGGGSQGNASNIHILDCSITASSEYGAGIGGGYASAGASATCTGGGGSDISIFNSTVTANSTYSAGIGGGYASAGVSATCTGGNGSDISISNSTVTANSTYSAGIGGGCASAGTSATCTGGDGSNISISNSTVTANSSYSADIGGGYADGSIDSISTTGRSSDIYISGGSVKGSIGCTPSQSSGGSPVYLCEISNVNTSNVTIDDIQWSPLNHSSNDTTLYAWLTGEDHIITVGNDRKSYIFDSTSSTFTQTKHNITASDFVFAEPSDLTYDGEQKNANVMPLSNITGMGNITVKYFSGDQLITGCPVNVGTYTVKIDVAEGDFYTSSTNLTNADWTFSVTPATNIPNFPSNTTISVPWSCKKVEDVTLPEYWIWQDTDKSTSLQVGKSTNATAVYNGADKGNYVTETVTYTITRSECEHKHTAGRYYSSASCTSSGYSGDTYCTDCNKTLSYGYTISAYGHDYDEGVITTEPTADTGGTAVYTCKRCKYQDTRTLGRLGDGEPYIDGTFLKKGWDSVSELIKISKENDTISINLNGAETLPASVLSGIRGKDISLNLNMGNDFIWKISGTSVTAETPTDMNLSVTRTSAQIPKALYELVSTNQNDFGFHLGTSGTFDFPAVLSVKADSSCAGLMANLFWYDAKNGILQCIQTETVSGALERATPYVEFTLSKGQDYFVVFSTESMNGRTIHTNGSITDENGAYLRPADTNISGCSVSKNKLTVKLSNGCAGSQGYDFVISKKSNMLQTGKFTKTVSSKKAQAAFKYLSKGTWYAAARSWILDAQGNKVYGSWSAVKKIKVTVVTPQQPTIKKVTVKGNTVTITYTKCKNATGYEILIGSKYTTSADEKYPVKKYIKRTGNTTTVTFKNVKKGTWYIGMRSWNKSSKDNSRVYSPYSTIKKFKVKK